MGLNHINQMRKHKQNKDNFPPPPNSQLSGWQKSNSGISGI
jgi:hypothetical protein